jgi:hypothetical protein
MLALHKLDYFLEFIPNHDIRPAISRAFRQIRAQTFAKKLVAHKFFKSKIARPVDLSKNFFSG